MMRLLWIDIESTGLDHEKESLLEYALALTDEKLRIVASQSWTVYYPEPPKIKEDYVFKLHTRNGLLKAIVDKSRAEAVEGIGPQVVDWMQKHDAINLWPASANPGFDRDWTKQYFPDAARLLHSHRNFEMNSVYALHEIPKDKGGRSHRALDDLKQDIAHARRIWRTKARRSLVVRAWNGTLELLKV